MSHDQAPTLPPYQYRPWPSATSIRVVRADMGKSHNFCKPLEDGRALLAQLHRRTLRQGGKEVPDIVGTLSDNSFFFISAPCSDLLRSSFVAMKISRLRLPHPPPFS